MGNSRYKFRAWDEEKKYMYPSVYFKQVFETKIWEDSGFDNLQIMQFTGLKDKNGQDVFEWDIVKPIQGMKGEHGVIVWLKDKAKFDINWRYAKNLGKYDYGIESVVDLEVIGNIYENPDLLT